jgi:argininosuccinate lyase
MDAVSDRDFVAEYLFCASLVMVHLSRLGEELILWAHPSLGWVELPEEFCTGSSLMPQKRNPDMAELARGKTGRVAGRLGGFLTTLKGLPLAYNRDLQEDKEPLFDSADTVLGSLSVLAPMVEGLAFDSERLSAAAAVGYSFATDLAEFLASRGVPFRKAHGAVGALVQKCIRDGKESGDLTLKDLQRFSPAFTAGALTLLSPAKSVAMKDLPGGTAPARVAAALKQARKRNT